MQIIINKYNFAIYYEESSYYIKRIKEEKNVTSQLKYKRSLRQYVAYSTSLQYKKKNIEKIFKLNQELSEEQKHYINH